jgi:hypothetical protein
MQELGVDMLVDVHGGLLMLLHTPVVVMMPGADAARLWLTA